MDKLDELAKVELLLQESRALRYRSAQEMVRLAERARDLVLTLGKGADSGSHADLRARVFAELANAYRLTDQLDHAEEAIDAAFRHFEEGARDPMLLALIADRLSTLLCHRRHFPEALGLLDILIAYYRSSGEGHLAGRALVKRGLYTDYSGDTEHAVALTVDALNLIDAKEDPATLFSALHNLLDFASKMDCFDLVRRLLPSLRPLYGDNRLNLLRLRWIEGRIASGPEEAEQIFREVRRGFLDEGLIFPASLVSLDLALLLAQQGRAGEIVALAAEMVSSFKALRVGREAIAALILLRRAAEGPSSVERIEERVRAARHLIQALVRSQS